ncbi:GNAT family N-acetyltransferase [Aeromicrobium piscarium]|uniref:GNAT family N-acetyltransferase n=1 Tax=Aeromicrobium piscarium TaxID=2590901 RepID=A0A554SQ89_9ACTN|nr:GNAT family N-acetyltransferase [Aeromicrobium piscarium]TSD68522.1 GNAT family N-acetyltransferase [Aeromicrobium piscarium]
MRWHEMPYDDPDVVALMSLMSVEMNLLYGRPAEEAPPGAPVGPGEMALTLLGDREGAPVATASLRRVGEDLELKRMYVAADARGEGMGASLLERTETEARRRGVRRLVLHTGEQQTAAVALYRSRGYQPIGSLPGYEDVPGSLFLARSLI